MVPMELLLNLFKNIFLRVFLIIFFFSITISFSDSGECSNDEDYMCFFNLAYEKTKAEMMSPEYYLTDEESKIAINNYKKFITIINEHNYKVPNDILINTYIELARQNYYLIGSGDYKNFEIDYKNFKEVFNYIVKAIDLGGAWNSWRYCDYAEEFVDRNISEDLSEDKISLLQSYTDKALDYCLSFIDQDQYLPFYESEPLSMYWNEMLKEQLVFEAYYNTLWHYEEKQDALEVIKYALLAEKQIENKKEIWFDDLENNLIPRLYNFLGWSYSSGYGVPKDYIKSNEYLEKAAELNDYNATSNLGDRYRLGEFVDQDFSMAKYYYEKTLEIYDEDPWTLFHLGEMYHFGWGVDENKVTAKTYFEKISSLYDSALKTEELYYSWALNRLKDAAEYANNFKAAINVAPENVTDEELNLLTEKIRLEELKKNQDAAFHGAIDLQLEKINGQIEQSSIQRNAAETNKKLLDQITSNVKILAGQSGSKVQEFVSDDKKTAKENIDEYINQKDEDGKYIFDNGCLHCHGMGKDITNFEFDTDKLTFSFLNSKLEKNNHFTIPYIVRKGTYTVSGRRQYMPQYPLEKMSDNQLFDLIGYVNSESQK